MDELRCQDCNRHHVTAGDAHACDEGIKKYGRLEWRRMTAAAAGLNRPRSATHKTDAEGRG